MEGPEGPVGAVALVEVRRETGRRRVRPLSMVLGRASGHTRAGFLGTPAAQGAPSPSCRGASAVGVGGSLFTSGDGLSSPGSSLPGSPPAVRKPAPAPGSCWRNPVRWKVRDARPAGVSDKPTPCVAAPATRAGP